MMDILMSETCWAHKKWSKIASDIKLVFYSSTRKSSLVRLHLQAPSIRFSFCNSFIMYVSHIQCALFRLLQSTHTGCNYNLGFRLKRRCLSVHLLWHLYFEGKHCQNRGNVIITITQYRKKLVKKHNCENTGLFEMIVGVLTTCHTQHTWDRSVFSFYLIEHPSSFCYVPYRCSICAPFVILQTSTRISSVLCMTSC